MAIRKIAVMGNPVLRKVAQPVPEHDILTPAIQSLIQDMIDTMVEYDGGGLAAPQIHESLRMLVMPWDFNPKEKPYLLCLINPEVEPLTKDKSEYWEGCLSVPGLRGRVARPNRIEVRGFNEKKEKLHFIAEGFAATVIQHEFDHLNGVLYLDRMENLKDLAYVKEFHRYVLKSDYQEGVE